MRNLSIIVPCYNEESVINQTAQKLSDTIDLLIALNLASSESSIYFVDDGSTDRTWSLIEKLATGSARFHGIKLSRNRGQQCALFAGMMNAPGDIIVSIDADLQDDPDAIQSMMRAHYAGADIVYGVRASRNVDSALKRCTALAYYDLLRLFGVELVHNHADFRLLNRRAIDALREYSEVNLFLRGIIPQLGFKTTCVYYERKKRERGVSKYRLGDMIALAVDGITSFSTVPLRLITLVGLAIFALSLIIALWALSIRLFTSQAIPGWASTVIPMYFIGGIQLFSIGVIGEYISKIYLEAKRRPRYIIEKIV